MRRVFPHFFWIVAFICFAGYGTAQHTSSIYSNYFYSYENGLPSEHIKDVVRDKTGRLWIAVDEGVVVYDGISFRLVPIEEDKSYCKKILCTQKNQIFVVSDHGLHQLEMHGDGVRVERILKGGNKPGIDTLAYPKSIFQDRKQNIWIGDDFGVARLSKAQEYEYYRLNPNDFKIGTFSHTYHIVELKGVVFAIGYKGEIYRFEDLENKFVQMKCNTTYADVESVLAYQDNAIIVSIEKKVIKYTTHIGQDFLSSEVILDTERPTVLGLYDNSIWVGTWDNKIYALGAARNEKVLLADFGYYNLRPRSIFVEDQNVWVGSNSGLMQLTKRKFNNWLMHGSDAYVFDVGYFPGHGTYFIDSSRLGRIEGDQLEIVAAREKYFLLQIEVWRDELLVSDDQGIIYRIENGKFVPTITDFEGSAVYLMQEDKYKNLWLRSDNMTGIVRLDSLGKMYSYPLLSDGGSVVGFDTDEQGNFYVGGNFPFASVLRYNYNSDQFNPLPVGDQLDNIYLTDFSVAKDEFVIATGVGAFLSQNGMPPEKLLGMATDKILAVEMTSEGQIWAGSEIGLCLFENGNTQLFDQRDGMSSMQVTPRCLALDQSGKLLVGTLNGVTKQRYLEGVKKTLKPYVIRVAEDNQEKLPENKIYKLTSSHSLKVDFGCNEFPPFGLTFRYRLHQSEKAWKSLESQKSIFLADIPSGTHVLEIQSKKWGNYAWSDSAMVRCEIEKVWYASYKFWGFIVFVFFILLFILGKLFQAYWKKQNRKLNKLVTERTKELRVAKDVAEKSSRVKADFLSVMSHEIRTPMNGVIGSTNLLIEEPLSAAQQKHVDNLKLSADNLMVIINDILDFNQLEAGKMKLEFRMVNLRSFLFGVLDNHRALCNEKELALNLEIADLAPGMVKIDTVRLGQVLNNLISNAIKFTHEGSISVEVKLLKQLSQEICQLRFVVKDTGIGIEENHISKIFDNFTQADSGTRRNYGGTGLGLSICKKIINQMQGKISVESILGKGSCFFFEIEVNYTDKLEQDSRAEKEMSNAFQPLKGHALIVDDNPMNVFIAQAFLAKWGLTTKTAENGKIAFEMLQEEAFDVVVLDLFMPVMDGLETAQKIRASQESAIAEIPIIIASATINRDMDQRIFQTHPDGFVTKPLKQEKLYQVVKDCLSAKTFRNLNFTEE